ncbi:MAG: hypothetical protein AABY22_07280, partial [Nanoarchaeota archaeon]
LQNAEEFVLKSLDSLEQEKCEHEWQGLAWHPETQDCKKCGITWRKSASQFSQPEKPKIEKLEYNPESPWKEEYNWFSPHNKLVRKINEIIDLYQV